MTRDDAKPPTGLHVLVAGGGVAGLETVLALRALAEERVDIELLAPETHFWYRPLAVQEPFAPGRAQAFELAGIAADARARSVLAPLERVDASARVVRTTNGMEVAYGVLVVACGARPDPAFEEGLTFRGPADSDRVARLLGELEEDGGRLVFAIPGGVTWPLPAYELAMLSARRLARRVDVSVVTPEPRPLDVFGTVASEAVGRVLAERGVRVQLGARPVAAARGRLRVEGGGWLPYDRLVALPRLRGPAIPGLPSDEGGFLEVDENGRVRDTPDVYAAGDATAFPVKQGGIAAQQADAVAEDVAARAGAPLTRHPFRPVLRALLLTGEEPLYLRAELEAGGDHDSTASTEPLWWPPAKIMGRYLAPYLAERQAAAADSSRPAPEDP